MKINISNRNLKKKHERGLQEQRKKNMNGSYLGWKELDSANARD